MNEYDTGSYIPVMCVRDLFLYYRTKRPWKMPSSWMDQPSRNERSRLLTRESTTQTSSLLKKAVGVAGDVDVEAFVVAAVVDEAFVVVVAGIVVEDVVDTIPTIRRRRRRATRII
jgi:hypothetical protein